MLFLVSYLLRLLCGQDVVQPQQYTAWCSKLLVQYKAAFKLVQGDEFPNIEAFVAKYRVRLCRRCYQIIWLLW